MQVKQLEGDGDRRTYVVILDSGEEVVESVTNLAKELDLGASRLSGVGAFDHVVLGFYDFGARDYNRNPLAAQVELLSLLGDIALKDGKPQLHAHVVVATADGMARGGHLLEARVHPTLELMIEEAPGHLQREFDPASGLALIKL